MVDVPERAFAENFTGLVELLFWRMKYQCVRDVRPLCRES